MSPHARIERGFEVWGRLVYRWRWVALAASLLVAGGAASLLPGLRTDNSTESQLLRNDPALDAYDAFREEFGQDQFVLVSVEVDDLFDLEVLERLSVVHEDLEANVPYLNEITSLINVRDTRGNGDVLTVGELLDEWPRDQADLERLRERVFSNPFYRGQLINDEGTLTVIVLEPQLYSTANQVDVLQGFDDGGSTPGADNGFSPLTQAEVDEQLAAIQAVVERHSTPDFRLRWSGDRMINAHLSQIISREAGRSILLSLVVNAFLLAFLLRRVSGVVLPLVTVFTALIVSFGTMAALDIPMSVANSILPRFLIVVGICNAVHILTGVYQRVNDEEDRASLIAHALGRSGLPVVMASLTTAGGVLAFVATDLQQVVNLGITAAGGVVLVLVYSLVMLPACIALIPLRRKGEFGGGRVARLIRSALQGAGAVSTAHPWRVLAVTAAAVVVSGTGIARLHFAQKSLFWFPETDPVRQTTELLNDELAGVMALEVLIDTGRDNGVLEPDVLNRLERAMAYAESVDHEEIWVGKAMSLVDVVKETNRALNSDDPAFYKLPQDGNVIAQQVLLFENGGADDLADFVDPAFRTARMTIRQPFTDLMLYEGHNLELVNGIAGVMGPAGTVEATGMSRLFGRTFSLFNVSMGRSYVLALLIITPLMVLMIGSLRLGLLAMIPNLVPIALTLGLMGWRDMPLDNSTLLLGCVIIGLAVDDTIHFIHGFRRFSETGLDAAGAVQRTMATTGPALLTTTLVLTLGFLVGTTAYLSNIVNFAILAAFACSTAFIADIFLAPALVTLFARRPAAAAG